MDPEQSTPKKRPKRSTVVIAAIAVVALIAGGVVVGVKVSESVAHDRAIATTTALSLDYTAALAANRELHFDLSTLTTAAADYQVGIAAVITTLPGLVGADELQELTDDNGNLLTALESIDVHEPVDLKVNTQVDDTATTDALNAQAATISEAIIKVSESNDGFTGDAEDLTEAVASVQESLLATAETASKTAEGITAAAASAGQAEKDALAAAVKALDEVAKKGADVKADSASLTAALKETGIVPVINAYVAAAKATQNSHLAVETQKAIDAAVANGEGGYTDPSTGQYVPTPNTGGGGSQGGGGNSGGGGDSGGGDNGGGGSNWQPIQLVITGSTCSYDGSQEVTYGSTLMVPGVNLAGHNTYEIPGYGWGVSWFCSYW